MADIKLRIEVNPNAESEFIGVITNDNARVSNTSIKVDSINQFVNPPTTEFNGSNGLLWREEDYLVFNDNDDIDNIENTSGYLESEESPNEFFWGIVPLNKEYNVKLTFTGASNLKDIVVFGDKLNNQFPTEAIIDGGKTIYSDDYRWAINLGTDSNTHTIEFTKWNRANYNACLTLIRVMLRYWEVDKFTGLKSVESLSQSTGQPKEIFYGVVSNQGSAEIIDVDGEIADMVSDVVIPNSDLPVEIYVNGRQIQKHITTDSDYNVNSATFSLTMGNKLQKWDNINYSDRKLTSNTSLYEILSDIFKATINIDTGSNYIQSEIDNMLNSRVLYNGSFYSIKEYLRLIIVPYAYLLGGSVRDCIEKICTVAQLNVLQSDSGRITFVSARPILDNEKSIVTISRKYQVSSLQRDFILKNQYKSCFVPINKVVNSEKMIANEIIRNYYNVSNYSSNPDDYKDVLANPEYNPNIIVIYNHIASVNSPDNNNNYFFYSILKFNIELPDEDIPHDINSNSFMWGNDYSWWSGGEKENPLTYIDKFYSISNLYQSNLTDDEIIIGSWVDYKNGNPVMISSNDFDIKIRINNDNTITVYFLCRNATYQPMGTIRQIILVHNLQIKYNSYDTSYNEKDTTYDYEFPQIELIQPDTKIQNTPLYQILQDNIISDYSKGIITGSISICCADYYDINGNKVIDWSSGETLQVGDIVRIESVKYANGEDMYFKITGRRFRYAGVPLIDLELQEVKVIGKII